MPKAASLVYDTEANLDVDHDLNYLSVETKSRFLVAWPPLLHVSGDSSWVSLIIWRNDKQLRMIWS